MAKKPALEALVAGVTNKPPKKPPRGKRIRKNTNNTSESLDVEIIRTWVPHLVACDFDRDRSIAQAFPTLDKTPRAYRNYQERLIQHPLFTEVMAAHLDGLDDKMAGSERYVLDRLYNQAEANVMDYFTADENGQLEVRKLDTLPLRKQQNIKKLKVTNKVNDNGLGRKTYEQTVDIEIVDSYKPIALLGKNLGMFIDKVEVEFGKNTADRLEEALNRVKEKRLGHKQPKNQSGNAGAVH